MSREKKPFARIAITLPPEVLAAADHLARRLDRSRSWVIAEAIRRFAASERPADARSLKGVVREPVWSPYAAAEAEAGRLGQLRAALALSPAERLRRAEALLELVPPRARTRRKQVISFESWEDFAQWKAARRIGL